MEAFSIPPKDRFASASSPTNNSSVDQHAELKAKKAWELATSPAKAIPMNAFMMWMAGSGVQIFSIMITGMMIYNPIIAISTVNQAFTPFVTKSKKGSSSLLLPKITFVFLQLLVICLGVWKCATMGLLPTASSDWLAFLDHKTFLEVSTKMI